MKIAAEVRLKHGTLWEVCQKLGGANALAEQIGIGHQTVCAWLNLVRCPTPGRYTRWYTKEVEEKLEEVTGVSAEELFPTQLREITALLNDRRVQVSIRDIEPVDLLYIADNTSQRMLTEDPHEQAIASELKERIAKVLKSLSYQEREVVSLHFGLDDGRPREMREIAEALQVTRQRVSKIVAQALRKLQKDNRKSALAPYMPSMWRPQVITDAQAALDQKRSLKSRYENRE